MKRIALILADQFYASGVAGTLDLLQLANGAPNGAQGAQQPPLFEWKIYSADGLPRTSSCGLPIAADGDFASLEQADAICLPTIRYTSLPQLQQRLTAEPGMTALIREAQARGSLLCANCTGVICLKVHCELTFFARQASWACWACCTLRPLHTSGTSATFFTFFTNLPDATIRTLTAIARS